jgi:hypothetical protein
VFSDVKHAKETISVEEIEKIWGKILPFWGLRVGRSRDHVLPHISPLGWKVEKRLDYLK